MRAKRLLEYSPWLLGLAWLLLLLLLSFFAVNNYSREKLLITASLEQKSGAIVHFVEISLGEEMRRMVAGGDAGENFQWEDVAGRVLRLVAGQAGVVSLKIVLPETGGILASSADQQEKEPGKKMVLSALENELLRGLHYPQGKKMPGRKMIPVQGRREGPLFLSAAPLRLFFPGEPGWRQGLNRGGRHMGRQCPLPLRHLLRDVRARRPVLLVALDWHLFSSPLHRQSVQIFLQLLIIVLVGIGGLLSFAAVQRAKRAEQLERQLQRSQRLVATGKMAAGIAHELRNPLSSIKGLALLLQSRFAEDSQEMRQTEIMVQEVERLDRSVGELLDFSRPMELVKTDVGIGSLLRRTAGLLQPDIDAAGIRLQLEISAGMEQQVLLADEDKLIQVLLNLLLNAIQSFDEDCVRRRIGLGVRQERNRIVIMVRDSGKGIEAAQLHRVFDPYFTSKSEGTGLGLALSAKIIEEHGGRLELESEAGKGTVVKIILPLK